MSLREYPRTQSDQLKMIADWKRRHIDVETSKCEDCGRRHNLSVEHIIPLRIMQNMGIDERDMDNPPENWRVLCRICNAQKSGNLDFNEPRTKYLLLKYIALVEDCPRSPAPPETHSPSAE